MSREETVMTNAAGFRKTDPRSPSVLVIVLIPSLQNFYVSGILETSKHDRACDGSGLFASSYETHFVHVMCGFAWRPEPFEIEPDVSLCLAETHSLRIENMKAAELHWPEVKKLDRESLVALVPVGSMEHHGPHRPFQVDVLVASRLAKDLPK